MEERIIVLLLPGVSHGLLHLQAVLDIGLEPLAELRRDMGRQGEKGHEIWPPAAEHGEHEGEPLIDP